MRIYFAFLLILLGWSGNGEGQATAAQGSVAEHQERARQFLAQKQPALAIPELQAVVSEDPKNLDAQANLGVLLYFTGHLQEAEPHLRAALALAPQQSRIQALLGLSEHRNGELSQARVDLSAALPQLDDKKIRRQAGLELIEVDTALGDLPAAAAVVSQLKAELPTDAEVLYAAYSIYTQLGEEAMLDLSVAAPDSGQMHQAMAHELSREHDNTGAIKNLREALAADPRLPAARLELADLLRSATEPALKAEAEQQYELALQQNPNDYRALTSLGDIAADKGQHDAAMKLYRRVLANRPNDVDASIGLAHELNETGKPEEALPLLLASTKADPTNVLAHYRLSAVYRRLHRTDDSKREVAEYQRLKEIRDKLQQIYQAMRMDAPHHDDATP